LVEGESLKPDSTELSLFETFDESVEPPLSDTEPESIDPSLSFPALELVELHPDVTAANASARHT
jgi:hypothetical protein